MTYAKRLFLERGFRKVTIEELCTGMAMSKRTFYKYFKNRDELVEALISETIAELAPMVIGNLDSGKPIGQILQTHFNLLADVLKSRITTQMMVDIQDLMPEAWERIESFRNGAVLRVIELIRRGQADGTIRPEIDPAVMGTLLQTIMGTLANPGFIFQQGLSIAQVGQTLSTLVLHGIFNPEIREGEDERNF
jgi:AcrR family transcriptional regulator